MSSILDPKVHAKYYRDRNVRKRDVRKTTVQLYKRGFALTKMPSSLEPRRLPVLRADCPVERPCPHVSCKWNLYLDATATGNITMNFPDIEPDQMGQSCVLDVAERGGLPLELVGEIMNMTRERVRQIEEQALAKMRDLRKLLK